MKQLCLPLRGTGIVSSLELVNANRDSLANKMRGGFAYEKQYYKTFVGKRREAVSWKVNK